MMAGKSRADLLLVMRGLVDSRARAQAEIKAGHVRVAGRRVAKPSETIDDASELQLEEHETYVSRGARKLIAAVDAFGIDFRGKQVLDLGASTGGFTQVALERGAAHVTAIDVGRDQMHASIRSDARVTVIEGLNARDLMATHIAGPPDIVLADLSFISLTLGLPAALALAASQAELVALIKPQFEAGRSNIGKGGVVKDSGIHAQVCKKIETLLVEAGWQKIGLIESPILGGAGNREFLIGARRG